MTRTDPPVIAPASVALRTVSRVGDGDWLVLVVPDEEFSGAIRHLAENIRAFGGEAVVAEISERPIDELIDTIANCPRRTVLLIHGLDSLTEEDWRHIDLLRSRLLGSGTVVLIASRETAARMSRSAPNLASWIGGAMWMLDLAGDALSRTEREERLKVLRRWSGLTDEEAVRRAEEGRLPDDPQYTEWLVLLDRADLIAP